MKDDQERQARKARKERHFLAVFAAFAFLSVSVSAQRPDPVAVERGQKLLVDQCGFCHGANARGNNFVAYDRRQYIVVGAGDSLYAFALQ